MAAKRARPWHERVLRSLRRWAVAVVVRAALAIILTLPLAVSRAFVGWLIRIGVGTFYGGATRRHLALAFPKMPVERREEIAKQVPIETAKTAAEWLAAIKRGEVDWGSQIDDGGAREVWDRVHASGRGAVGVAAHVGNWELLGPWMTQFIRLPSLGAIVKRQPNPRLNELVEQLRRRIGFEFVYRDENTNIVRALRRGSMVATVPDQDIKDLAGAFIEFLGRPAYTPIGPARLALAARVPIVCTFLVREGDRFRVLATEPIEPDPSNDRAAEIIRLTEAWSREVEQVITRYPEQWSWFHDRWKTTPEKLATRGRSSLA